MLHEGFRYAGFDVAERVLIASANEFDKIRLYAKDLLPKTLLVTDTAKLLDVRDVECIEFRGNLDDHIELLAELLSHQVRLKYLALPPGLLEILSRCSLSADLETIQVIGTGRAKLPDTFAHPRVERLIAIPTVLQFRPENLPGIRHLHVQFDKQGRMRKSIENYTNLISVTMLPTQPFEDFSLLPKTLQYLRLIDGSLSSLVGLSQMNSLTNLHLQNLSSLSNVEDVIRCQSLREVSIGYCNSILRVEAFSDLPKLERFQLYGSQVQDNELVVQKFGNVKLKELVLNI